MLHRAPNDAISTMLHPIARNAISRNKLKRARHLRSRIARTRAQLLCRSHFATPSPVSSSPQTCSETYAKSPRPAALNWNAALLIEFSHHHRALVDPFELNTVAWNYRERTGEIDDAPLASRFLAAPSNKWSGAASDAGCSFRIRLLPLQKGLQNGLKLAASTVERAFTCGLGAGPALPGAELSGGRCSR